jgi:hypothetical protein
MAVLFPAPVETAERSQGPAWREAGPREVRRGIHPRFREAAALKAAAAAALAVVATAAVAGVVAVEDPR